MFDRPDSGEKAILVHIDFEKGQDLDAIEEFRALAISAGASVVALVSGHRQAPDSKYFIGQGKVEELQGCIATLDADLVLFNHQLSPAQERNLEGTLKCRVLDRTTLILDIFAQRARTYEGKLQVELAQLRHLSTRLVRGWTHLERQKGGIGLRGPGETQLESDRRMIRGRLKYINQRLAKVKQGRAQSRSTRARSMLPVIALVGYTNAGKSTLFNAITGAQAEVADKLFATLDPLLRRVVMPGVGPCVFVDTVGFIQDLPHQLVEAFSATLEETVDADLLLHVVDAQDAQRQEKIAAVNDVLAQIEAHHVPQLYVYNKVDVLSEKKAGDFDCDAGGVITRVWLSAQQKEGLAALQHALIDYMKHDLVHTKLQLGADEYKLRTILYDIGAVEKETYLETGVSILSITARTRLLDTLCAKSNIKWRTHQVG